MSVHVCKVFCSSPLLTSILSWGGNASDNCGRQCLRVFSSVNTATLLYLCDCRKATRSLAGRSEKRMFSGSMSLNAIRTESYVTLLTKQETGACEYFKKFLHRNKLTFVCVYI